MIARICARLILVVGIAGLAQVKAGAQATINATQSQFGTEPAPYAPQPAQPVEGRAVPASGYAAPGAPGAPAGYAPPPDTGSLGAPDPTKPLGRGDIVTFSIAQDREQPQVMRVTDTGELDFSAFPRIGRVSVVGRTCAQVAAELKRRLEADYYNAADVSLGINQVNILSSRGKVFITGNVRAPGPQELPANERTTVSNAIIRAGGFDKFANEHKVKVTRKDKTGKATSFTVDVKAIIVGGHMEKDVEIQDGDYINVPQNVINF
jgi:polysaccharide export outer membrane protein